MRNHRKSILLAVILLATTMTSSGCFALFLGAAAGAGSYAYVKGELKQDVDQPIADVHEAALAGINDIGLYIMSDELNRHDAFIRCEDDYSKDITIKIKALTEYTSQVKIRVGTLGDKEYSTQIMDAVVDNL